MIGPAGPVFSKVPGIKLRGLESSFVYIESRDLTIMLLSNWENREHRKNFSNVDGVLANHNKVQDTLANLKSTNYGIYSNKRRPRISITKHIDRSSQVVHFKPRLFGLNSIRNRSSGYGMKIAAKQSRWEFTQREHKQRSYLHLPSSISRWHRCL